MSTPSSIEHLERSGATATRRISRPASASLPQDKWGRRTTYSLVSLLRPAGSDLACDPRRSILRANGIAPTTQVFTGSLASATTNQRRQDLSFALVGIRNTLTVAGSQTRAVRIDPLSTAVDDFANNNLVRPARLEHWPGASHDTRGSAQLDRLS
jgi:hypothetical protein